MKEKITENNLQHTDGNIPLVARVSKPLEYNKIYNGDSFELCERVPAKTVDLILEDMPYNTTACEWDVKIDLKLYWETRLRILKPTGVVVLTGSQPFTTDLINSNRTIFQFNWVWDKKGGANFMNLGKRPMKEHEDIIVFGGKQITFNPIRIMRSFNSLQRFPVGLSNVRQRRRMIDHYNTNGIDTNTSKDGYRHPRSIIEFSITEEKPRQSYIKHPTRKPVGLFEYLIRTYTNESDLVFDGFGGSGTTAVAAYKSKRNFIVIEKEKKYFDLAVRRLDVERAQYTIF